MIAVRDARCDNSFFDSPKGPRPRISYLTSGVKRCDCPVTRVAVATKGGLHAVLLSLLLRKRKKREQTLNRSLGKVQFPLTKSNDGSTSLSLHYLRCVFSSSPREGVVG
jgi:hypothetical protein